MLLPLPLSLSQVNGLLTEALAYFPPNFDSKQARVQLLANGGLESDGFRARRQYANGPARGILQFEQGNAKSRGGVWAVLNHRATSAYAREVAEARGVAPEAGKVWAAMEFDDVLALAFGRLLLWADAAPLPRLGDVAGAYACYIRTWNPGKPKPDVYPIHYSNALRYIESIS